MKKSYKKTFLFIFLLLLIPMAFILAQGRKLEVDYPIDYSSVEGLGPETVETPLTDYVKYIFNISIAVVGLIALAILIWSGTQYFTSAGDTEMMKSAKDRIKSAFLGIIVLLFSYLILTTINPQLVVFQLLGLPEIETTELPDTLISSLITTDLLGRVKETAEIVKKISDGIKKTAEEIRESTDKCDCENTQSLCVCTGGGEDDSCEPRYCYIGPDSHPCPNFEEIKNNQGKIIAWKDEILYYRNRALAEREDLIEELEKVLAEKISWYNEEIATEEKQGLINYLEEERDWLIYERDYKENLKQKLKDLAEAIAEIEEPADKTSQLPDECSAEVKNKCTASCKGECHYFKDGCEPDKCSGGNPCPASEIQSQVEEVNSTSEEIIRICNEIISIINGIKKIEERTAVF